MIKTMEELLREIVAKERELLKNEKVAHGPTIGSMYENLTSDLLEKAVFNTDKIKVVSGFIKLSNGKDSPEMDCIVTVGEPETIRRSNKYRCKIEDVIAVIPVKKTLYADDIDKSFENLMSAKNIDSSKCELKTSFLKQTFQQITGVKIGDTVADLDPELAAIYSVLVDCIAQPACIAIGFEGYVNHDRFRKAIVDSICSRVGNTRFGISSMPDLVMNQNFAAIKLNGVPFYWPVQDGWWPIYGTTQVLPIMCMLEILYTKMVLRGLIGNGVFGDDLDQEPLTLLASCKYSESNKGFEMKSSEVKGVAAEVRPTKRWEPVELTEKQYILITMMCRGAMKTEEVLNMEIEESDIEYLKQSGLIGVVAGQVESLSLITSECQTVILPDGRYIAAENASGRLSRWVENMISVK